MRLTFLGCPISICSFLKSQLKNTVTHFTTIVSPWRETSQSETTLLPTTVSHQVHTTAFSMKESSIPSDTSKFQSLFLPFKLTLKWTPFNPHFRIFRSIESSVDQVLISDMVRLLNLDSADKFTDALVKEQDHSRERGFEWNVSGEFVKINKLKKIEKNINAEEVIQKMIAYAHEIEAIN